jgi:hypothetical protein
LPACIEEVVTVTTLPPALFPAMS